MACQSVQMWSLSGLVAAFLDLTIAYLLLCASSAAYLTSKFLGLFGLNLPCPCDGMFINVHSRSLCFNRLLVDFPIQKLSDAQLSVRQKFPFSNSASPRKYGGSVVGDNCGGFGVIELEGDASCSSSISDGREISSRTGKIDVKRKGVLSYRPKSRLRGRKGAGGHGKNSFVLSSDLTSHEEEKHLLHFNVNKRGSWCSGDGSQSADDDGNHNLESPKKMRGRIRTLSRDEMDLSPDEDKHMKGSVVSGEERQYDQQEVQSCGELEYENNKIRALQKALERERAARASLYIDLVKERSAAASAADEAMAMILRLQNDKASVEMEARQYQRIIEEKSAYDGEEMDIVQEILMRREKEKLFLEREVEAYRVMVSQGNEQSTGDFSDSNDATQMFSPLNDPNDDPVLFQDQLAVSSDGKVKLESKCADNPALVIESSFQPHDEKSSFERRRDSSGSSVDISVRSSFEKMDLQKEVIRTCYEAEKADPNDNPSLKQHETDSPLGYSGSCDPTLNKVPQDKDEQFPVSSSPKVREIDRVQSGATPERINDSYLKKSNPEVPSCLPPLARRGSQSLRRCSMGPLDSEMLKIDTEIVQLQERLKRVQEGKEKLSFPLENRETKHLQLNMLEDIAQQIQGIRCLTEPPKSARHASLPLKGLSKRRRSRSVSSGFRMSSEG
ncbi:uncharacterized protein LOC125224367 [Salvia hispanica]|uniref:uncharacterized protein LOC125224367 n=1 Tax=Salvia hispanica TaxID=49212 RepID=UPI002008FFFD|nr:uncharacterized protein LOC125224367 [Salvia hispanica]